MNFNIRLISTVAMAAGAITANATLTDVGQFTGSISESFESFANFNQGPVFQTEPWAVMGGGASFTSQNHDLAIYEPSAAALWYLDSSGWAQVADGTKGMGMNSDSVWDLTFVNDQTEFGGFWGLDTPFTHSEATVSFFDASNNLVGQTSFSYDHSTNHDGGLDWNGWSSDIAFRKVEVQGRYMVVDGIQAAAVPEPASLSVMALGIVAMLRRRKTR
ncbi:MAG: PEP-CTERM sorting domain-containing protein [Armatimonadetes bacterium]|nr:PEP-CTERM sorting domain-containing protein [Armatimonadota bacterium]